MLAVLCNYRLEREPHSKLLYVFFDRCRNMTNRIREFLGGGCGLVSSMASFEVCAVGNGRQRQRWHFSPVKVIRATSCWV